jgi:GNAT superfamily N-acetyltransferase
VEACITHAQKLGYKRMTLWTNDVLTAARTIYETTGFELVHSEPHHSFGKHVVGETWERDL